jgi:ribonuclease J
LTSPDIISRGFIYMRDSEELMNAFRTELRRAVQQRFKRVDLDRFKAELKDHVTHFLFEYTGRSPIVIPVVNVLGGGGSSKGGNTSAKGKGGNSSGKNEPSEPSEPSEEKTPEQIAAEQQQRFEQMRAKLLGQDARTD